MARHRTITREQVLDAAQAVVLRDGAGQMTLGAVAREAGISKARVLYDYKSKQELIKALIERSIGTHRRKIEELAERLDGTSSPGRCIRARIEAVRNLTDEERAVTTSLCAAMTNDPDLRKPLLELFDLIIDNLRTTSRKPRGALLAFLATEGLAQLEWLGYQSWRESEREALLADIGWLAEQDPGPPRETAPIREPSASSPAGLYAGEQRSAPAEWTGRPGTTYSDGPSTVVTFQPVNETED
ncbi:TetR/AcrR family transcriptional regulator [Pseudochelatococcus sp. B33]